ncbi:MAG: GNAT family N-acetyltransferase [Caldilineaceae bacterium]
MAVYPASTGLKNLPESGIRPFDVGRDLRPVAELIASAFAQELDQRGESALREMRVMSHFSSVIKVLNRSTGEFDDYFGGFVWLEEGKVVGNVTVQRAEQSGGRWQIANVAVAPAYRGRGIARRLMQRALAHIDEEGGKYAVLQVYENNQVALRLYKQLGFEEMGGTVDLRHEHLPKVAFAPAIPNFFSFSSNHWQPLYELANNQLGSQTQWWRAIRRVDFQLTFEQQLGEWFAEKIGRQQIYRRCIQTQQRFDAALILTAKRWRGEHKLQLWVRPEQYGKYEASMLHWVFATLQDYPRWPLQLTLSKTHSAALTLAEEVGFTQQRALLTMRKEIVGN